MTKKQFQQVINKFGLENLIMLEYNNNKRFTVYPKLELDEFYKNNNLNINKYCQKLNYIEIDMENELVYTYEQTVRDPYCHCVPFEFVEGAIFKNNYSDDKVKTNNMQVFIV